MIVSELYFAYRVSIFSLAISCLSVFKKYFSTILFFRLLKQVNLNPGSFEVDPDQLKPLERLIARLENQIINSNLFEVKHQFLRQCSVTVAIAWMQ